MPDQTLQDLANAALAEVGAVFAKLDSAHAEALADEIAAARTIALHGVGREGLQMKGFAMRLFHLGLHAHVVGDMTTPPIGHGDLLIVSAGPGQFSTVLALMQVARDAGARTLVVTAQPGGEAAKQADVSVHLPAQTMADDQGATASVLPMGSLYETAQMVFFELVILGLRDRLKVSPEGMRHRHTNLE